MGRRLSLGLLVLAVAGVVSPQMSASAAPEYSHFVGAIHEHSGYSDGKPGTRPATYYTRGRTEGLDFMAGTEHSDNLAVPVTLNETCLKLSNLPSCPRTDRDSRRKWEESLEQARRYSTLAFTGLRGFEWTSDRFGHINVLFSEHNTNAKIDGGYVSMDTFYRWLATPPSDQGGSDGLGIFNHPGAKELADEPAVNWNDFAYVASADDAMVGIEVYNDTDEFGTTRDHPEGYYVRALDKGWHLGPVGAEDLHGTTGRSDYGAARWAKTVILSTDRSPDALKAAMQARRFYAIRTNDGHRLDFTVDDAPMGSRLQRPAGAPLHIAGSSNHTDAVVEVVTSGGQVVATGTGSIDVALAANTAQRYYFLRVKENGNYTGYSAPVWISPAAAAQQGEWLAGDLHVHTCFSHDAYCPPNDDNTGPEEFYTYSGDVGERFLEASVRGLDYLAITDHNDIRSQTHQGFGANGVIAIPAYENSLNGHAQMVGAKRIYGHGAGAAAITAMADELRADGGAFQINHPADQLLEELDPACSDTSNLDWGYGFGVVPDTIEVWNIGHIVQPPMPAGNSNDDSERYWECWLDRGYRVGATGGSDSHWLALSLVQGPGNPTTWVFAPERSSDGVIAALRAGRTSVSLVPPVFGALRLILEADADGDGIYESMIGDEVPPGTAMRVRADGLPGAGLVTVRANGRTIVDKELLLPTQTVTFDAPSTSGWVRAVLDGPDLRTERRTACDSIVDMQTTYCRNALVELGLTSPIYLTGS